MNVALNHGNPATRNIQPISSPDASKSENGSSNAGVAPTMTGIQKPHERSSSMSVACIMALVVTTATGLLYASFYLEYIATLYLLPQLELMHFTETDQGERGLTYYHRVCSEPDLSTTDPNDFIIPKEMPTDEALQLMLKHGTALLPELLKQETVDPLREFILKENERSKELIYVIENENRWSFPIQVDQDPSVTAALEELLGNEHLVRLLEAMCGPDPAVIEFTAITAAKGATQQYWHQDVTPEGSAAKYARHFIPSFSLFIPLQNTTSQMGATGVCPGTHMCSSTDFCETSGFQVSGPDNKWPMGAGALVNQQTTHRGEAHTDGPHRVVFILTFAPRPRHGPFTVETRMIGTSGSYSLHWSQWGHTLSDFRQPLKHMRWRVLRSLGLYKSNDRFWGWDYVTSSLMRITHEEFGFGEEDLENFLKKGGMRWLPSFLQGSTSFDEGSTESLWTIYLRNTLKRCQALLLIVYGIVMIVSLALGSSPKAFRSFLTFVAMIHIIWLLAFYQLDSRIQKTVWARNIRNKLSNRVPDNLTLALESSRATLPTLSDVMRFDKMKSRYMHSFEQVLEVAHPGNAEFHTTIEHYATGYGNLTQQLQRQIRLSINESMEGRRVLAQTPSSGWAEVPAQDRDLFLHEALLPLSLQTQLLKEVSFLLSESRFGYHRNSAIHRIHIPQLLAVTRQRLLTGKADRNASCASLGIGCKNVAAEETTKQIALKPSGIARVSKLTAETALDDALLPQGNSFLAVGDSVDAIYGRDFDYWYRGTIIDARPFRSAWVVQFDDGDIEKNACEECVVASEPFAVGETVEIQTGDGSDDLNYETGQVIAVHGDLTLDIDVEGEVWQGVPPSSLRRRAFEEHSVMAGDRVRALFPGAGSVWYAGTIVRINDDGTVAINYDDGDYLEAVPTTDIRFDRAEE